ncbi:MAG TPA: zinc ribbon domain-containing protein [Anaerolineales bacterium]|nr:zinc ribbon domain-containing protein [Anaerolineales bacterium]
MPNYEFRCLNCKRRFEVYLSYNDYGKLSLQGKQSLPGKPSLHCPHCQSDRVQRRIGRVRFARSEESRLDSLADPDSLAGLEDDPQAMARMMRQMSSEMGEELGPEFDEVVDRLEAGQSPEEIESAIPDLGSEAGGLGDDFGD